ncbi:MAG: carbohydrate ABC transporter permease [Spirochaetes bacterium]|nr:carbohydrate ABC transporter permease [Spirochaetota bacterium]MBU1079206.1 carbohydrate ABC transporter permease [Spirochaetota bacterium]
MSRKTWDKALFYAFAAFFVATIGFPFFWQVLNSFKLEKDIFSLTWFPDAYTLANYRKAFQSRPLMEYMGNSIAVSVFATLASMALGSMAAYALARTRIRGTGLILIVVLSVSLLPPVVIVNPIYALIRGMGLLNTRTGLVIVNTLFTLTLTIWFLVPYMHSIPAELEEAAEIDGAGPWICYSRIIMPLVAPGVFTVGILAFIQVWNEYLFALVMNPVRVKLVTVGLKMYESDNYIPWGTIMAASTVIVVPLIAMVLALQKRIISGLTSGGLKE